MKKIVLMVALIAIYTTTLSEVIVQGGYGHLGLTGKADVFLIGAGDSTLFLEGGVKNILKERKINDTTDGLGVTSAEITEMDIAPYVGIKFYPSFSKFPIYLGGDYGVVKITYNFSNYKGEAPKEYLVNFKNIKCGLTTFMAKDSGKLIKILNLETGMIMYDTPKSENILINGNNYNVNLSGETFNVFWEISGGVMF